MVYIHSEQGDVTMIRNQADNVNPSKGHIQIQSKGAEIF